MNGLDARSVNSELFQENTSDGECTFGRAVPVLEREQTERIFYSSGNDIAFLLYFSRVKFSLTGLNPNLSL